MTPKELAESFLYDAWNQADYASGLLEDAKLKLEHGLFEETRELAARAKTQAVKVVANIDDGMRHLAAAVEESKKG